MPRTKGAKTFWAVDSEYIAAGLKIEDDVINFGFANNFGESYVFHKPKQVRDFIDRKRFTKLFIWCMLPEFGSFVSWSLLGVHFNKNPLLAVDTDSPQVHRFEIERANPDDPDEPRITRVFDVQAYFKTMRWNEYRLSNLDGMAHYLADYFKDSSLVKPKVPEYLLGKRKPETKEEWKILDDRVRADAVITAKATEFLEQVLLKTLIPEPNLPSYWSWGTVARKYFQFPQNYLQMGREVLVPYWHDQIVDRRTGSTFAGRSECFSIGQLPPSYYEDVASLYPVALVASDALRVQDVVFIEKNELDSISKPESFYPYVWLYGEFETSNDLWGLPVRSNERNYYVTGTVTGLYNSLDLQASHAAIKKLYLGLRPVFRESRDLHERYAEMTMKKLEKRFKDTIEKEAAKGVLNSATGAIGQQLPQPNIRSNFPGYNVVLAESHLIMSRLFDMAPKPIHYQDTDSMFLETKFEGTKFEVRDVDEKITMPVTLEQKAFGEKPRIFRSKHYYLDENTNGFHAIHLDRKDWTRIVTALPDQAVVNREIRGTLLTRSSRAKELQLGRWMECSLGYDLVNLEQLFNADNKRMRESYNSYSLARAGRFIGSRAWTWAEFMDSLFMSDTKNSFVKQPSGEQTTRDVVRNWRKNFARELQEQVHTAIEDLSRGPFDRRQLWRFLPEFFGDDEPNVPVIFDDSE